MRYTWFARPAGQRAIEPGVARDKDFQGNEVDNMAIPERVVLGNGRPTFRIRFADADVRYRESARWTPCGEYLYQNGGAFEGRSICEEINAEPVSEVFPPGFVLTYGPEAGPRDLKRPWRQALSTWHDDALPAGLDREGAKAITSMIAMHGLPSARFFRHKRADGLIRERVLMRLDGSSDPRVRYLDYDAAQATDPARLDDMVSAYQTAVILADAAALPADIVLAPDLSAHVVSMFEEAHGL